MRLFTVKGEPEWVPTLELRWRQPQRGERFPVLEQKWMSEDGTVEWRQPPVVAIEEPQEPA